MYGFNNASKQGEMQVIAAYRKTAYGGDAINDKFTRREADPPQPAFSVVN
jgi:hypothetical protein